MERRVATMNRSDSLPSVAVLGGGLTGLTAAWHLKKAGVTVRVYEAGARAGGVIGAYIRDGWLHELGPNSLLEGSADVANFINDLGLGTRRLYAAAAARNRYVVKGGRLVPMPTSPTAFLLTKLFSWRAKFTLLGEPFRPKHEGAADESVSHFVIRRLGEEFLDYAVNPFVSGVYAGDPGRLSVRHGFPKLFALEQQHGSLIRGAIKRRNASGGPSGRIFSFPDGLSELPRALAQGLGDRVALETRVTRLRRVPAGWEVETERSGRRETRVHSAVIAALPADVLATLPIEGLATAGGLAQLREIEQPPVTSVLVGYKREAVRHPLDGFGVLMPEVEHGRILGALFTSTLFPNRAPDGHVAINVFVGGARHPELARQEDAPLVAMVRAELERLLGAKGEPAYVHLQRWPRAIPQYTLGYERFQAACAAVEAEAGDLFIGGNSRDGISMANCIASGHRLADVALARIKSAH